MTLLPQSQVVRCYAQDKRVYATVDGGAVYLLRERLYELEEQLDRGKFVRISNGEIINLDKVKEVFPWGNNSFSLKMKGYEENILPIGRDKTKILRQKLGY